MTRFARTYTRNLATAVYDDHAVEPGSGSGVLCVANLNWYAQTVR